MNSGVGEIEGASAAWLEVRLAGSKAEIEAAQRLRYRVFYEEMGAQPNAAMAAEKRDFDEFDDYCDHLLVINNRAKEDFGVIGTYRLHRRDNPNFKGYYSSAEYDIAKIEAFKGAVLELGRSCVDAEWRTKMTMQLLWRGIAGYVFAHKIDLLFGCASLSGTDPDGIAAELTYLHHNHLAPPALRPRARTERYVDMRRLPPSQVDNRRVLLTLPPLIKGYLRLGGMVGDGAVVDHQFNTTDVAIVVKTDLVTDKYIDHYKRQVRD